MNPPFFQFEQEFISTLNCIPMIVRYKLDTCGVKLKLAHWNQFNRETRQLLIDQPIKTSAEIQAYRQLLYDLVQKFSDLPLKDLPIDPHPPWSNPSVIPETVQQKAAEFNLTIETHQWKELTALQRFALVKLSRPSHENKNFLPALKEFNLLGST